MHTITEAKRPIYQPLPPEAELVISGVMGLESRQESLFREFEPAEELNVPDYLHDGEKLKLPSMRLVTQLGNEARLVSLVDEDKTFQDMYEKTAKVKKGTKAAANIQDRTYETIVRVLDTNGAQGLHHIHHSDFPHTIYFVAKRGNGIMMNVYVTEVGRFQPKGEEETVPVFAFLTATKDKRSEYAFFRHVGAGDQKGKYSV